MNSVDFFTVVTIVLGGTGLYGLALIWLERASQRRFFAAHPELPNPYDRPHTGPAE